MERQEKLNKIKKRWREDYFIGLGIYQHLVECKQKFEMVKNHAVSPMTKEELQSELDKELADLKIFLDMYVKEKMVERRLDKFLRKINGN